MTGTQDTPLTSIEADKTISTTPPTPLRTLQSWLPLYLKRSDRIIERLSTILSTPSGTDSLLSTACYTSLLASTVLSSISIHKLHRAAQDFIEKAILLPPNTTLIIDTATIPKSNLLIASQRLKALSEVISEFRMFTRLWGLLGLYKWGKSVLTNPSQDSLLRNISYMQVVACVLYQYLENGAYLSTKKILSWSPERQSKAWIWSVRFWGTHVALDIVKLLYESSVRKSVLAKKRIDKASEETVSSKIAEKEWEINWRKKMLTNLAWAPLTVHWGRQGGLVNEFGVGMLASIGSVLTFSDKWMRTA